MLVREVDVPELVHEHEIAMVEIALTPIALLILFLFFFLFKFCAFFLILNLIISVGDFLVLLLSSWIFILVRMVFQG